MLGDLLTKTLATAKIDKFLATHAKRMLSDMSLNNEIESSLDAINKRMQARLKRLENTVMDSLESTFEFA